MNLPYLFFAGYLACWILATRNALVVPGGTRRTGWAVGAVMLTVGLAALLAARCSPPTLDSEGFIHEPFYLIGGGSLLSLAGSCVTLGMLLRLAFVRRKQVTTPASV